VPAYLTALKQEGDELFGKRLPLLSLWQELAEHFYPERADFTTCRNLGEDMAAHLMTSAPVLARRDLGNAFGAVLRPSAQEWFHLTTNDPEREDVEAKRWLEDTAKFMRRAMYDRKSLFARATKEADHDFAVFGQAVLSTELNGRGDGLLYRCWHLRDVAWAEGPEGTVDTVHRNWKPTIDTLVRLFPKTVHARVRERHEKKPFDEIQVRHIVVPVERYQGPLKLRTPFVGVFLDCENEHELEAVGLWTMPYQIPRWQTVSGSQYAHSPAAVASLPDGRLIQAMTRVVLTAGEKAVDPPMVAVKEAIRNDVAIYPGGITWVDSEYDERLGEVLRPLSQDRSGLGFGLDLVQDIRAQLQEAWYLSKLNLPPTGGPNMTAYEVGQRVQEFIRNALPLFEPMESEYNGPLCDATFELLLRHVPQLGRSIPPSLQGADLQFTFESPLRDAVEKAKIGQFMEVQQILSAAAAVDQSVLYHVDTPKAARDVLAAAGPVRWLRTEAEAEAATLQAAQAAQAQQQLAMIQEGSQAAKTLGEVVR
jgi:hypothetical protein